MSNARFKFRVYIPDENRYMDNRVDNPIINGDGEAMWCYLNPFGHWEHHSMEKVVIEQCTGQRDKNGKLIFEGDVVHDDKGIKSVVIWLHGGFYLEYKDGGLGDLASFSIVLEIIGNVHEMEVQNASKM